MVSIIIHNISSLNANAWNASEGYSVTAAPSSRSGSYHENRRVSSSSRQRRRATALMVCMATPRSRHSQEDAP